VGLIFGPGALAELVKTNIIKMHDGEMEISVPKGGSVELHGPDDQKVIVKGTQTYRVARDQKLQLVNKDPKWLQGFKGALAAGNESLGALVRTGGGPKVP